MSYQWSDYDTSGSDGGVVAADQGSGWDEWNSTLQDVFKYGFSRWIDSETRQNNPNNVLPGFYGSSGVPIATTGATSVSNKALLAVGAVVLVVLAVVAFKD